MKKLSKGAFLLRKGEQMSIEGQLQEQTRTRVREPKRYHVIMHNDDFTPMDFVVLLLEQIFHKEEPEAVRLMYMVHRSGKAAVGIYPYDIAVTKVQAGMSMARAQGYPFRLTVEEVG